MRRDEATLLDIAKAARLVMTFTQGMAKEEFLNDLKIRLAITWFGLFRQVTAADRVYRR